MAGAAQFSNAANASGDELDEFIRGLFGSLVTATKASNAIPGSGSGTTGVNDFAFLSSFPGFVEAARASGQSIVDVMLRFIKYSSGGADPEISDDLADPALYELVVDAIDGLLEEADLFLDQAQGKVSHDEVARAMRQVMKYDKERIIRENVKDIPKPQNAFLHEIRNSRTEPFNFQLLNKPHAISPIPTLQPVETVDPEVVAPSTYMPNVYEEEIKALAYHSWQLEAPVTPQMSVPFTDETFTYIDTEAAFQEFFEDLIRDIDDGSVREIAVDLEAHAYRSFQGLTCLMQLSTRQHDFVIDTLALRGQMKQLLEVFANPHVVKVMHGADKDVMWLQRDFQIYIVNLFDTYQAAKLMRYPALSLAHLLKFHCGVTVNKKYQLDDWRQRPLPKDMVAYARSDTHYLLFVYDAMLREVQSTHQQDGIVSVLDACKRVCLQHYEKDHFRPAGFRRLLEQAGTATKSLEIGPEQENVLSRLWDWRDQTARDEDESIPYVMSRAEMLRISLKCPKSEAELQQCGPLSPLVRAKAQEILEFINAALDILPAQARPNMDAVSAAITPKAGRTAASLNSGSQLQWVSSDLVARLRGYNTTVSFTLAVPATPVSSLNRQSPAPPIPDPSPAPDTDAIYRLAGWKNQPNNSSVAHTRSFSDSDALSLATPTQRNQSRYARQVAAAQRDLALQVTVGEEDSLLGADEDVPTADPESATGGQTKEEATSTMSLDQVPQSMAEIYQLSNRTRKKYKEKKRAKESAGSGDFDMQAVLHDTPRGVDPSDMDASLVQTYFSGQSNDTSNRGLEEALGFAQNVGWVGASDAPGVLAEMAADTQQHADYSSDGSEGAKRAKHTRTNSRGKDQHSSGKSEQRGGSARKHHQGRDNKKPRGSGNEGGYTKLVHHRSVGALSTLEHNDPPPQSKSYNPFIGGPRAGGSAGATGSRSNQNRPRPEPRDRNHTMTYGSRGY